MPEAADRPHLIVDCHLDLAWNALGYKRDLTLPLAELNAGERGLEDAAGRGRATTTLVEMRQGGVGVCLGTLIARAPEPQGGHSIHGNLLDFPTATAAAASASAQLTYYRLLAEQGELELIASAEQLERHVARWRAGDQQRVGLIIAMEGSDPIIGPEHVTRWRAGGLRVASLVHYGAGRYAGGTGTDLPLNAAGRALLRAFAEQRMILDVTHLSDAAFFAALEAFDGPILASHQNCRELVPDGRQFTDEQLRLVIERGGIVAAACDAWMLYPGWQRGTTDHSVLSITAIADHIDHVCQLAGNAAHAAIGSDLDGGYGNEQTPRELRSIADLQRLAPLLSERGYSAGEVDAVLHGNALRFLGAHLPATTAATDAAAPQELHRY